MEQNVVNDLLDYGYKIVQNPSFFNIKIAFDNFSFITTPYYLIYLKMIKSF